jgi:hypothetical protein
MLYGSIPIVYRCQRQVGLLDSPTSADQGFFFLLALLASRSGIGWREGTALSYQSRLCTFASRASCRLATVEGYNERVPR